MKTRNDIRGACTSRRRVTAGLLLSFLALSGANAVQQAPPIEPWTPQVVPQPGITHEFTLRHIFHRGTYQNPNLHKRLDIAPAQNLLETYDDDEPQTIPAPRLLARASQTSIERLVDRQPSSIEKHLSYARLTGDSVTLSSSQWSLDEVPSPDITDKETVVNLAIMAANAYVIIPGDGEWEDVSQGYNESQPFGWEGDGLRGHIFADDGNKTIIMSLKGTSPAVFDGDGTTTRDKVNDNLFFSCCCAQGGQYFWRQVCDCYSSTYTCNSTCLVKALRQENRYYKAAIELYTNVTEIYPTSNIWLVGHSLGGSVSSLLGLTFGLPVVTFEAPGDALPAQRLGLPSPPSTNPSQRRTRYTGSVHIGHTADPVFMGTCNGATATCTLGGYAMESQCHTGLQCVYDTVEDYGWRVGIGNHKVHNVIDNVIRKYPEVPKCVPDDECVDCFNWKYFESNGSDSTTTTTTTSTTSTRTRTSTCKTPGWWGCLDETTTTSPASATPIVTTTYTTTSCATPGWFGCKNEVNITVTTTTTLSSPTTVPLTSDSANPSSTHTISSTCHHPGWFGCNDPSPSPTSSHTSVSQTASIHTCETPGFFFGCRDSFSSTLATSSLPLTSPPVTQTQTTTVISTTTTQPHKREKCKHRIFFGLFCGDDYRIDGSNDQNQFQDNDMDYEL